MRPELERGREEEERLKFPPCLFFEERGLRGDRRRL